MIDNIENKIRGASISDKLRAAWMLAVIILKYFDCDVSLLCTWLEGHVYTVNYCPRSVKVGWEAISCKGIIFSPPGD